MITYKDAGVDIKKGEEVISDIKEKVKTTFSKEVIGDIGGFGAFFMPNFKKYDEPVLVSGTDGVGTKLKIAFMMNKYDTIGIDLVAMCVNDIVVHGAKPLFFLDYLSTGKINKQKIADIIEGITQGCKKAKCALIGGETAEMPGFYKKKEFDLAGFAVGIVDRKKLIEGKDIIPGDKIIGISSNGLHSNGYSLVRKLFFEYKNYKSDDIIEGLENSLGTELLKPTHIYVHTILNLIEKYKIKGMAHITGGGLSGNIPRILLKNTQAVIKKETWPIDNIFKIIQHLGCISEEEMYKTFNMGIGLAIIAPKEQVFDIINEVKKLGDTAYEIGEIRKGQKSVVYEENPC